LFLRFWLTEARDKKINKKERQFFIIGTHRDNKIINS
jgi:hypothetical protein